MKQSIDFFYRVAKEAELAEDENGNPSECYLKIGFNLKDPVSTEEAEVKRERTREDALKNVAELLNIDASLLNIVTEEEYLAETEED